MRLFFYFLSPFSLRLGYVFCDFIALIVLVLNTEIVKISRININIAYFSKNKEYRELLVKRSVNQSIRSYYETLFCLFFLTNSLNAFIFIGLKMTVTSSWIVNWFNNKSTLLLWAERRISPKSLLVCE